MISGLPQLRAQLPHLTVDWVETIDSTQSQVKPNALLLAEHQQAGVGRRGNRWLTPAGRSICLSYRFELPLAATDMGGFSLTVALAALNCLQAFQPDCDVSLKWPNDLLHQGQKFAGILITLIPKSKTQTEVIVGLGMNWSLTDTQLASVDQAVCNVPLQHKPQRHDYVAQLIRRLDHMSHEFIAHGWIGPGHENRQLWEQHDLLLGKGVRLKDHEQQGRCHGVDDRGQLLVEIDGQIQPFSAGEVSVRSL